MARLNAGFRKNDIRIRGSGIRNWRQVNRARMTTPAAKIAPSRTDTPLVGSSLIANKTASTPAMGQAGADEIHPRPLRLLIPGQGEHGQQQGRSP